MPKVHSCTNVADVPTHLAAQVIPLCHQTVQLGLERTVLLAQGGGIT